MNGSNRYTNLSFSNLRDLPKLQVPYEQLNELLSKYEEQAKLTKNMLGIKPNYIEKSKGDVDLATQVIGYQDDVKDKLAKIAKEGNVKKYMQGLDEAQSSIKELYSPGGAGYTLQTRYAAYQKEKERILESTKEYTNPLYAQYFHKELDKQIKSTEKASDIYDIALKKGTSITPVNLAKEVNVATELDNYFKGWASDKGVNYKDFYKDGKFNLEYFVQQSTEKVTEEELREAVKNFYDRPEIKFALKVEASSMEDMFSAEDQAALVENSKEVAKVKNNLLKEDLEDKLKGFDKLDNKEKQNILKKYNKHYDKSFQTIEELKTFLKQEIEEKTNELNANLDKLTFSDIALDQIKSKYTEAYVPKFAYTRTEEKLYENHANLIELKKKAMRSLMQELAPTDPVMLSETDVKTTTIDNFSTQFQKNHDNFNETQTTLNKSPGVEYITEQLKSAGYSGTNLTYNIAKQLKEAYTSNLSEDGNLNKEGFKQAISNLNLNLNEDKVVELISKEVVRNNLNSFINNLEPSYLNKQHSIDAAIKLIDEATPEELSRMMQNISLNDFGGLDENIIHLSLPARPPFAIPFAEFPIPQETGIVFRKKMGKDADLLTPDDMRRNLKSQLRKGNSKILKALDKKKETKTAVTTISSTALDKSNKTLLQGINSSLKAMISSNIYNLSEEDLNALGYDEDFKTIEGEKVGFTSATIGIDDVDGKKRIVISGTTHTGKPIILIPQTIQDGFLKNQLLQVIGATINEEGNIKDETTYNTLLPVYFDGVVNSSGLSVDNISRNIESNNFNSNVGRFNATIVESDIIVKLIKTDYGDTMLVSYPATYESKFENARDWDNTFDMNKFMDSLDYNEKKFIETAKIDSPSYNDVNKGISRIKIEWAKPLIEKEIGNPFKVKTSSAIQSSSVDEFRILGKILMDSE